MAHLRSLPLRVLACTLLASAALVAQPPAPAVRIVHPIDESQLVTLKGNTHPAAIARNDRGPVSADFPMADLVLVLSRSPEQQAAFDAYVQSEYDSGSPNFHRWLTPDQIGQQFGPAQPDVDTLTAWLTSHGFQVNAVGKDRMSITFSGTAGQVESAFHTQIHHLEVQGVAHIGNMSDPQIPAALAPVIVGIKALHDFHPHPLHRLGSKVTFNQEAGHWQRAASSQLSSTASPETAQTSKTGIAKPLFGINIPSSSNNNAYLEEDVTPYDFATIYNVQPLWNANINGSGQTIAIVGTSDINLNDVTNFRSAFGLPAGVTPIIKAGANGIDPGQCTSSTNPCNSGDLVENTLDVEWSGAVAPQAQIVLVTSGYNDQNNPTNDPIYQSAQYILDNVGVSGSAVQNAHVMSVSYGLCELAAGTASNVSYYNLWSDAAAEGVAVFVASGDSGAPSCDQGGDGNGWPYSAQYGPSVSGLASTPYNTAVGGTDFQWCQPVYNSTGSAINGCPTTSASAAPYWNSTNGANGASASGYVPEIPWNDSCENPILAKFLESIVPLVVQGTGVTTVPSNADAACNYVENYWAPIDNNYSLLLATYVDSVGGSGGASNCVVNDQTNTSSCYTASTTGAANGSIPLTKDGWQKPSWQTGITGIPNDGVRDIPDVSFFAADGALNSAYLICVSALGSCLTPSQVGTNPVTTEPVSQEVGGTSVATPAMAGVMALIDQKVGTAQGSPNAELYKLAGQQTYASCSAESVKNNSSCFFNDVDSGTIAMPCSLGTAGAEGGVAFDQNGNPVATQSYTGLVSPDCTGLNSGDVIGTLTVPGSTTTQAYNAGVGFDLATGLGSLNVANVVNGWTSDVGAATATVSATLSATTLSATTALTMTVTVTGSNGTPTGSVTVNGPGANGVGTLSGGSATVAIAASSLAVGSDTLTVTYGGNNTYASASTTATVTVTKVTPIVSVEPLASAINSSSSLSVLVSVNVPLQSGAPTGTVTLTGGSYTSAAVSLSSTATASFTVPANTFTSGGNTTLTANYSGDTNYTAATGTAVVAVTVPGGATFAPSVPTAPTAISSPGGSTTATVKVASTSGYVGTVTLSCALSNPTNVSNAPTCAASGSSSVSLTASTTSGTVNFAVGTTAATAKLVYPKAHNGKSWMGMGGGAVLAFLVFLGVPARRRSWRAMLGMLVLVIALGSLSACGGGGSGGGGGGGGNTGTPTGTYTFTVTATGNPAITPAPTTTFSVTVN